MKKLNLEYIEYHLSLENYYLIPGQNYTGAKMKFECLCEKKHTVFICWDKWKIGQRCSICNGKKFDKEKIKESLEKENYKLIEQNTGEYFYICPRGHQSKLNFTNWKLGHRCLICSKCNKKTLDEVKHSFSKEKYILIENEYCNARKKMKYICPKKHINYISWNKWSQGRRCPICSKISLSLKKKFDVGFIHKQLQKENFKLISKKYSNAKQKILIECPKKHRHYITYDKWKRGQRCKTCTKLNKGSIGEKLVETQLKKVSFQKEFIIPECKNIKPLPFDFAIFNSEKKLVFLIEFNGEQHYKPIKKFGGKKAFHAQVFRDNIKKNFCLKNKIPLLIIKFDQQEIISELVGDFLKLHYAISE